MMSEVAGRFAPRPNSKRSNGGDGSNVRLSEGAMSDTPTFFKPPAVDLLLDGQFSPLAGVAESQFDEFWQEPGSADDRATRVRGWSRIIHELQRIRTLEDDWDGEGTAAPAPDLMAWATNLAKALMDQDRPVPDRVHAGVNATVYFEWHTPIGYREIEVVSPAEAECRFVRAGSDTTEVVRLSRQA
jgi:hypothetical protein